MTPQERDEYIGAVANEAAGKKKNIEAMGGVARELMEEVEQAVDVVARLKAAREKAGISLNELETRTGIRKSVLSRLENSKAPNPTLATLQRYATAIGFRLDVIFHPDKNP